MISTYLTGRLGSKPKVIKTEKGNFLAFSVAVYGMTEKPQWVNCTYNFRGETPPAVYDRMDTGKYVVLRGWPSARQMPATPEYPNPKPSLCIRAEWLECPEKDREIKGPDEQLRADDKAATPDVPPDIEENEAF